MPRLGKVSFAKDKLLENASTLINAVVKAKPAAAKGKYVKSVTLCSTMGPGVALDITPYNAKTALGRAEITMKKKSEKRKISSTSAETFEQGPTMFVAGFEKLTVAQDFELRKTIRAPAAATRW